MATYLVRTSAIHGDGVFASRRIARGEWVVEYTGERITDEECERRSVDWAPGVVYHTMFFEVSPDLVIDGAVGGNAARYINHSCQPNCVVEIEDGRVQFYARRDIAAGDELTIDYAYEWEARFPPEMRESHLCRCGSSGCRGTIFASGPSVAGP